jgi:hypothetical protein
MVFEYSNRLEGSAMVGFTIHDWPTITSNPLTSDHLTDGALARTRWPEENGVRSVA